MAEELSKYGRLRNWEWWQPKPRVYRGYPEPGGLGRSQARAAAAGFSSVEEWEAAGWPHPQDPDTGRPYEGYKIDRMERGRHPDGRKMADQDWFDLNTQKIFDYLKGAQVHSTHYEWADEMRAKYPNYPMPGINMDELLRQMFPEWYDGEEEPAAPVAREVPLPTAETFKSMIPAAARDWMVRLGMDVSGVGVEEPEGVRRPPEDRALPMYERTEAEREEQRRAIRGREIAKRAIGPDWAGYVERAERKPTTWQEYLRAEEGEVAPPPPEARPAWEGIGALIDRAKALVGIPAVTEPIIRPEVVAAAKENVLENLPNIWAAAVEARKDMLLEGAFPWAGQIERARPGTIEQVIATSLLPSEWIEYVIGQGMIRTVAVKWVGEPPERWKDDPKTIAEYELGNLLASVDDATREKMINSLARIAWSTPQHHINAARRLIDPKEYEIWARYEGELVEIKPDVPLKEGYAPVDMWDPDVVTQILRQEEWVLSEFFFRSIIDPLNIFYLPEFQRGVGSVWGRLTGKGRPLKGVARAEQVFREYGGIPEEAVEFLQSHGKKPRWYQQGALDTVLDWFQDLPSRYAVWKGKGAPRVIMGLPEQAGDLTSYMRAAAKAEDEVARSYALVYPRLGTSDPNFLQVLAKTLSGGLNPAQVREMRVLLIEAENFREFGNMEGAAEKVAALEKIAKQGLPLRERWKLIYRLSRTKAGSMALQRPTPGASREMMADDAIRALGWMFEDMPSGIDRAVAALLLKKDPGALIKEDKFKFLFTKGGLEAFRILQHIQDDSLGSLVYATGIPSTNIEGGWSALHQAFRRIAGTYHYPSPRPDLWQRIWGQFYRAAPRTFLSTGRYPIQNIVSNFTNIWLRYGWVTPRSDASSLRWINRFMGDAGFLPPGFARSITAAGEVSTERTPTLLGRKWVYEGPTTRGREAPSEEALAAAREVARGPSPVAWAARLVKKGAQFLPFGTGWIDLSKWGERNASMANYRDVVETIKGEFGRPGRGFLPTVPEGVEASLEMRDAIEEIIAGSWNWGEIIEGVAKLYGVEVKPQQAHYLSTERIRNLGAEAIEVADDLMEALTMAGESRTAFQRRYRLIKKGVGKHVGEWIAAEPDFPEEVILPRAPLEGLTPEQAQRLMALTGTAERNRGHIRNARRILIELARKNTELPIQQRYDMADVVIDKAYRDYFLAGREGSRMTDSFWATINDGRLWPTMRDKIVKMHATAHENIDKAIHNAAIRLGGDSATLREELELFPWGGLPSDMADRKMRALQDDLISAAYEMQAWGLPLAPEGVVTPPTDSVRAIKDWAKEQPLAANAWLEYMGEAIEEKALAEAVEAVARTPAEEIKRARRASWREGTAREIELMEEKIARLQNEIATSPVEAAHIEQLTTRQQELYGMAMELEGLKDTLTSLPTQKEVFRFWDYKEGAFRKVKDPSGRVVDFAKSEIVQEIAYKHYGLEHGLQGAEQFGEMIRQRLDLSNRVATLENLIWEEPELILPDSAEELEAFIKQSEPQLEQMMLYEREPHLFQSGLRHYEEAVDRLAKIRAGEAMPESVVSKVENAKAEIAKLEREREAIRLATLQRNRIPASAEERVMLAQDLQALNEQYVAKGIVKRNRLGQGPLFEDLEELRERGFFKRVVRGARKADKARAIPKIGYRHYFYTLTDEGRQAVKGISIVRQLEEVPKPVPPGSRVEPDEIELTLSDEVAAMKAENEARIERLKGQMTIEQARDWMKTMGYSERTMGKLGDDTVWEMIALAEKQAPTGVPGMEAGPPIERAEQAALFGAPKDVGIPRPEVRKPQLPGLEAGELFGGGEIPMEIPGEARERLPELPMEIEGLTPEEVERQAMEKGAYLLPGVDPLMAEREIWQVPREEWVAKRKQEIEAGGGMWRSSVEADIRQEHVKAVWAAAQEGKQIPFEVIRDYPPIIERFGKQLGIAPEMVRPEAVAPEVAREPWQMTSDEFLETRPDTYLEAWDLRHEEEVKEALARGDAVPSEVLAEYPDLAPEVPEGRSADVILDAINATHARIQARRGTGQEVELAAAQADLARLAEEFRAAGGMEAVTAEAPFKVGQEVIVTNGKLIPAHINLSEGDKVTVTNVRSEGEAIGYISVDKKYVDGFFDPKAFGPVTEPIEPRVELPKPAEVLREKGVLPAYEKPSIPQIQDLIARLNETGGHLYFSRRTPDAPIRLTGTDPAGNAIDIKGSPEEIIAALAKIPVGAPPAVDMDEIADMKARALEWLHGGREHGDMRALQNADQLYMEALEQEHSIPPAPEPPPEFEIPSEVPKTRRREFKNLVRAKYELSFLYPRVEALLELERTMAEAQRMTPVGRGADPVWEDLLAHVAEEFREEIQPYAFLPDHLQPLSYIRTLLFDVDWRIDTAEKTVADIIEGLPKKWKKLGKSILPTLADLAKPPEAPAGIPTMITNAQREALVELGYSEAMISQMTPEQGLGLIQGRLKDLGPTVETPGGPMGDLDPVMPPSPREGAELKRDLLIERMDEWYKDVLKIFGKEIESDPTNFGNVNRWLEEEVRGPWGDLKIYSDKMGEATTAWTLYNYRKLNIDTLMYRGFWWPYWQTRTGHRWLTTFLRNPAKLALWARWHDTHRKINEDLPESYRDTVHIPDWVPVIGGQYWNPYFFFDPVYAWMWSLDNFVPTWKREGLLSAMVTATPVSPLLGMREWLQPMITEEGRRLEPVTPWSRALYEKTGINIEAAALKGAETLYGELKPSIYSAMEKGGRRVGRPGLAERVLGGPGVQPIITEGRYRPTYIVRVLLDMWLAEEITEDEFNKAMSTREGEIWDQAIEEVKRERGLTEFSSIYTGIRARRLHPSEYEIEEFKRQRAIIGTMEEGPEKREYREQFYDNFPWGRQYDVRYDSVESAKQEATISEAWMDIENEAVISDKKLADAIRSRPGDLAYEYEIKQENREREEDRYSFWRRQGVSFVFNPRTRTYEEIEDWVKGRLLSQFYYHLPQAERFKDEEGAIDWDAYNEAVEAFWEALPEEIVTWGDVQQMDLEIRDAVDTEVFVLKLAKEVATEEAYDVWRKANDLPEEALNYTWKKYIIDVANEYYQDELKDLEYDDRNMPAFFAEFGHKTAEDLIPYILQEYPDRWTEEELTETLTGITMPGIWERWNQDGDERSTAISLLWAFWGGQTKLGRRRMKELLNDPIYNQYFVDKEGRNYERITNEEFEAWLKELKVPNPWDDNDGALRTLYYWTVDSTGDPLLYEKEEPEARGGRPPGLAAPPTEPGGPTEEQQEIFRKWIFEQAGFTQAAIAEMKGLDISGALRTSPGGGGFAVEGGVQLHTTQLESAIHEYAHQYWFSRRKAQTDALVEGLKRLAEETDPQYKETAALAAVYVHGDPNSGFAGMKGPGPGYPSLGANEWNDQEIFAGLASFTMGHLEKLPPYMRQFYAGLFTGSPGPEAKKGAYYAPLFERIRRNVVQMLRDVQYAKEVAGQRDPQYAEDQLARMWMDHQEQPIAGLVFAWAHDRFTNPQEARAEWEKIPQSDRQAAVQWFFGELWPNVTRYPERFGEEQEAWQNVKGFLDYMGTTEPMPIGPAARPAISPEAPPPVPGETPPIPEEEEIRPEPLRTIPQLAGTSESEEYRQALVEKEAWVASGKTTEWTPLMDKWFGDPNSPPSLFWDFYFGEIPPGRIADEVRRDPIIEMILNKAFRTVYDVKPGVYEAALATLKTWREAHPELPGDPKEWAIVRQIKNKYWELKAAGAENEARAIWMYFAALLEPYWPSRKAVTKRRRGFRARGGGGGGGRRRRGAFLTRWRRWANIRYYPPRGGR